MNKRLIFALGILFISVVFVYRLFISESSDQTSNTQTTTQLVTWGSNSNGQIGEQYDRALPEDLPYVPFDIKDVVAVTSGLHHSVALTKDGSVYAWGADKYNQRGETDETKKVAGLPKIVKIAGNQHHTLALAEDGTVWAWGLNLSGQLGDGTNEDRKTPVQVKGLDKVTDIAAGYRFSLAIREDKSVWGWGGLCKRPLPTELEGEELDDYYDPLDSEINSTNEFNNCRNETNVNILSLTPKKVEGLSNIKAISSGFGQTLALTEDGDVYSWGCNKYGQIGRGQFGIYESSNTPAKIEGLPKIKQVSAGFRHSLALAEDGSVWGWGHNRYGNLGIDTKEDSANPIQLSKQSFSSAIKEVHAGYDYSLAVSNDGTVFGWGQNHFQQFGQGEREFVKPTQINKDITVSTLTAGGGHVLAIAYQ